MIDTVLNIDIDVLRIFLYSMFPVTELRVSIPYFVIIEKLPWLKVFIFSVLGNISIGLFVRYIISPIMLILRKNRYFNRPINYIINKTYTSSDRINKYKTVGLILFIGIPLPFTGVWTGALAAYLLSIPENKTILGITAGVFMSGVIVTFISLTGSIIAQRLIGL